MPELANRDEVSGCECSPNHQEARSGAHRSGRARGGRCRIAGSPVLGCPRHVRIQADEAFAVFKGLVVEADFGLGPAAAEVRGDVVGSKSLFGWHSSASVDSEAQPRSDTKRKNAFATGQPLPRCRVAAGPHADPDP